LFKYDGFITQNHNSPSPDGELYGFDSAEPDKFDENWIFNASPTNPVGCCWSKEYKPAFRWGNFFSIEVDTGVLEPGHKFETEPVVFAYGLFGNYNDFRNFAMDMFNHSLPMTTQAVELRVNNYNPFVPYESGEASINIDVLNNRSTTLEGTVAITSSDDLFEPKSQINPADTVTKANNFTISHKMPLGGMCHVVLKATLTQYQKTTSRALFFQTGQVTKTVEGGVYTVNNGSITFKAAPAYASALFSLVKDDREWLHSQYPEQKSYGWWNPFIGGIVTTPPGMNNMSVIKEPVTADFAETWDNFGNLWSGIRTTLSVKEHDELKGAEY
jgi:hypothetical protein